MSININLNEWEIYEFDKLENSKNKLPKITMRSAEKLYKKQPKHKYDLIREEILPEDHKLKGQRGVFANDNIDKYKTIAFYEGKILKKNAQCNGYTMNMQYERSIYAIDPLIDNSGNISIYINDYRDNIVNLYDPINDISKINCSFLWIIIDKKPYTIIIATRKIKKDDELLVDYGDDYWSK